VESHRALAVPTREHPFPDRAALQAAKDLAAVADDLSQRASAVRAQEVPPEDRVYHRLRSHGTLLDVLIACDARLAGYVESLNALCEARPLAEEPAQRGKLRETLTDLDRALRERRDTLAPPAPF
jgi:hypothetical protein